MKIIVNKINDKMITHGITKIAPDRRMKRKEFIKWFKETKVRDKVVINKVNK